MQQKTKSGKRYERLRTNFLNIYYYALVQQLKHQPESQHVIRIETPNGSVDVGGKSFIFAAGPCSVESHDGLLRVAKAVAQSGAGLLRGGAWKPRTSPYSFQGMGAEGLTLLAAARTETGLPIVTEVLDPRDVEQAAEVADVLQIGARNMANYVLLREVARSERPVMLKRGFGATVSELLDAAEYILAEGSEEIMLVERGIRTFEDSTRFTLDISAIPVLRTRTHLPIIVDPSHAAGNRKYVPALAFAAAAAGADGILVEVHDDPHQALSDADQALLVDEVEDFVQKLDRVLEAVGRKRSVPSFSEQAAATL